MKENALYLEADEDITSAIDKLGKIAGDSVQIVVPKRSTMLQSVINLKLLKKAAKDSGKELVLVTNDRVATDLAGRVGLAVAPSLGAKAVMAELSAPEPTTTEEVIEADDPEPPSTQPEPPALKPTKRPPLFSRKKVGDESPVAPIAAAATAVHTYEEGAQDAAAAASAATSASGKGPKLPDFNRLQKRLIWAGTGIGLIAGYLLLMFFFASAKITLYATGTKVDVDTTFAADPGLHQTDTAKAVLAAQAVTFSKDATTPITPTGKKDVGTKASGSMTIYNEYDTSPHMLVAGTRLQAPDGKTFRTRADVTVPGATLGSVFPFTPTAGKSDPVAVDADENGDSYNEAPGRYTIAAYSGTMQTKIYGQGAQMGGGTSKQVTVVTQADVDKAKSDLIAKDKDTVQRDLDSRVPSGYVGLAGSQYQTADNVAANPAVDQEATSSTLSLKLTYTQLAVLKTDYHDLIRAKEQQQIGDQNQIYDDGLTDAQLTATADRDATGRQSFHLATQAYGGAKLDKAAIAKQLAGKRYGDAVDLATKQAGVERADVTLWPFWSTHIPGRVSKITVDIQVANSKGK